MITHEGFFFFFWGGGGGGGRNSFKISFKSLSDAEWSECKGFTRT